MTTINDDKIALLAGLDDDIRKEIESVRSETEKSTAERLEFLSKQVDSILTEAGTKAVRDADAAKKTVLSGVNIDIKRNTMKIRESFIGSLFSRVRGKIEDSISTPSYREALQSWIAEAAAGLSAPDALVNASAREKPLIDETLLNGAAAQARELTGMEVRLTLDPSGPLAEQGVVVTARDGRTAYNNQLKTRIMRKERRIRNLIHDTLFRDRDRGGADPEK